MTCVWCTFIVRFCAMFLVLSVHCYTTRYRKLLLVHTENRLIIYCIFEGMGMADMKMDNIATPQQISNRNQA